MEQRSHRSLPFDVTRERRTAPFSVPVTMSVTMMPAMVPPVVAVMPVIPARADIDGRAPHPRTTMPATIAPHVTA
jgi:hypothetical protein